MRARRRAVWVPRAARALLIAAAVLVPGCAARDVTPAGRVPRPTPPAAGLAPRGAWTIDVAAVCAFAPQPDLARTDPNRVGGLSGLTYDAGTGTWLLVSDDPRLPRLNRIALHLDGPACRPELIEVVPLRWDNAVTGTPKARDFEDLAPLPDGSLLVVSEAVAGEGDGSPRGLPGILQVSTSGAVRRALPVPRHVVPSAGAGVRDNAAFESIAVSPGGSRVFVAVEQPLVQDDEPATFTRGGASRLLEFRLEGGEYVASREFVLPIDPVPRPRDFQPAGADIGVVALVALDDRTLLMLERSFVRGSRDGERASRNDILLSRLVLDEADDVRGVASLRGAPARPVAKQRLVSLADLAGALPSWLATLDNFEGMALGPRLADGSATLVLVSDDNFSAAQRTAFVVLRLR